MIINQQFKNLYKTMIDDILSTNGLTNPCTIYFDGNTNYCINCLFDKSSEISSNIYNGTGPVPFSDYTLCPVCMGSGKILLNNQTKTLILAVILDSKYFLNINTKLVNIPDGMIQTICSKKYLQDLISCSSLVVDANPTVKYERSDNGNLSGLGDLDYLIMNWKRI